MATPTLNIHIDSSFLEAFNRACQEGNIFLKFEPIIKNENISMKDFRAIFADSDRSRRMYQDKDFSDLPKKPEQKLIFGIEEVHPVTKTIVVWSSPEDIKKLEVYGSILLTSAKNKYIFKLDRRFDLRDVLNYINELNTYFAG